MSYQQIKPKKVISAEDGVAHLFDELIVKKYMATEYNQTEEYRMDIFRDEWEDKLVGHILVDTCCTTDTNSWETGVERETVSNRKMLIAEQYENKEKAKDGHEKWVRILQKDPEMLIQSLEVWEF